MAILGLSDDKVATKTKKSAKADKATKKSKKAAGSQEDEAKALLDKLEAKKDDEGCMFC